MTQSTQKKFALRVRGDVQRACLAAREAGLEAEVSPVCTTARGWLPDQAALFGWLALVRSRGLEIVAVRRTPSGPGPVVSAKAQPTSAPPVQNTE